MTPQNTFASTKELAKKVWRFTFGTSEFAKFFGKKSCFANSHERKNALNCDQQIWRFHTIGAYKISLKQKKSINNSLVLKYLRVINFLY